MSSVLVIVIILISVFIRFIGFLLDIGTQSPSYQLEFHNYSLPTYIVFLSNLMLIFLLLRQLFSGKKLFNRPLFLENKIVRLICFIILTYGFLYESFYFFSLLKTNDLIYILGDFFFLTSTVLLIVILVKPNRIKNYNEYMEK